MASIQQPFLVFGKPVIDAAAIAEVVDSLESGWVGAGPKVERFERALEAYLGVPHVRCLSSCTAALMIALEVLGIGPGDEVLMPAMTFVAAANVIEHTGATPVFVDSDPHTWNIDLDAAERQITDRTRAIMPVHMAGRPLDLGRLARIRDEHGLHVIEDAAHAIGAWWRGRAIGSSGNLTAFSFYATKNITTIEGGALATHDAALVERIDRLALHGLSAGAWQRYRDQGFRHYETVIPGYKANMTDVQAALGLHQLPLLDEWVDRRAELWSRYDALLDELPVDLPAPAEPDTVHARHLYQVLVRPEAQVNRDDLLDGLTAAGIGVGVHYRAVHLQQYYRERYGVPSAQLPVATDISNRTLSLPLSPAISDSDQDRAVEVLEALL